MRVIIALKERVDDVPLLRLYIHGAPHRRQHIQVIHRYRDELVKAAVAAGIKVPITIPIDLWVMFIDPCSPDLDNLHMALARAMDGNAHNRPTLLADDSLISWISGMGTYFPNGPNKGDRPFRPPHH